LQDLTPGSGEPDARPDLRPTTSPIRITCSAAEHAKTVIERLEDRFGETLQPTEPDRPGHQVIEIGRQALSTELRQ